MRTDGLVRQLADSTWALTTPDHSRGGRPRGDDPAIGNVRTVHHDGPDGLSALSRDGARQHQASLHGGDTRTLIIDGEAYDAISVGSLPVTRDYQTGSPLNRSHRFPGATR
jgi:hypothetical protein